MTSLAFSVYSGKGVYAVLLGSGISRSSGIPTGWDIVLSLIRKVAAIEGKECGDDPESWYVETYGKEPGYTDLLEMIGKTSAERMQILRSYFEPSEAEREEGKKQPALAHHAIAQLVAKGYIRVIVTTNFDRLMESALQAAGITPSVIASTDSILGAQPLTHARCTIIKVHGDDLDTRLKNTPDEVGLYDAAMDRLLDQIFDEYGLIVSGWSAEWDKALCAAIERCPNRRYATYWSALGEVSEAAESLCRKRDAQVIKGMGADDLFTKLAEKVTALEEMNAQHPLTPRIAVATLKRYLAEGKHRIRLHDLMVEESGRVADALFGDRGSRSQPLSLREYESRMETLLQLLAAGGYWGRPVHRKLWLRCFQTLVTPRSGPSPGLTVNMDFYPTYLALYAYGIGALAGGRPSNLAYILAKGKATRERRVGLPLVQCLVMALRNIELETAIQQAEPTYRRMTAPTSRYLLKHLREPLRGFVPEDIRYEELFRHYEYLISLHDWDLTRPMREMQPDRFRILSGSHLGNRKLYEQVQAEINKHKENWPFLKAGLFGGSIEQLRESKAGHDASALDESF